MTQQRLAERKRLHAMYNRLTTAIEVAKLDGLNANDLENEREWILTELRTVRT